MSAIDEIEALLDEVKSSMISTEDHTSTPDITDSIDSGADNTNDPNEVNDLVDDVFEVEDELLDDTESTVDFVSHESLKDVSIYKVKPSLMDKAIQIGDSIKLYHHVKSQERVDSDVVMEDMAAMQPRELEILKAKLTRYPSESNKKMLELILDEVASNTPPEVIQGLNDFLTIVSSSELDPRSDNTGLDSLFTYLDECISGFNDIESLGKGIPVYASETDGFMDILSSDLELLSYNKFTTTHFKAFDEKLGDYIRNVVTGLGESGLLKELQSSTPGSGMFPTLLELAELLRSYKAFLHSTTSEITNKSEHIRSLLSNSEEDSASDTESLLSAFEQLPDLYSHVNALNTALAIKDTKVFDDINKLTELVILGA